MVQSPVLGYRELSPQELADINATKQLAEQVGALITQLQSHQEYDQTWLQEGKMTLQKGFMSINRAIARPTTF